MLKITVIALGHKMPAWVNLAVDEFVKRLQEHCVLTLIEIPLLRRSSAAALSRLQEKEAAAVCAAIPAQAHLIALDIQGSSFSSEQLANKLADLQLHNSHFCFLIGGPEGLSPMLVARAHETWSLSKLTLPHTLARIVLLEALYRAYSILTHHPYHK